MAAYVGAFSHREPWGVDVAFDGSGSLQINFFGRSDISGNRAADGHDAPYQVCSDRSADADDKAVLADLDRAFDHAVNRQVLRADDIAPERDRLTNPRRHPPFI